MHQILAPAALPEYTVAPQYNRGYAQPTADIRGRGYFFAVGSLAGGLFALGTAVLFIGMFGLPLIPAIMAVYLGIVALKNSDKTVQTPFSSKAKSMSIAGIVAGIVAAVLAIAGVALLIFVVTSACESSYGAGTPAYSRCIMGY